jgi:hypothetical protein
MKVMGAKKNASKFDKLYDHEGMGSNLPIRYSEIPQ